MFAVVQSDPSKPLALPRTEADNIAASLEAPDGAPGHSSNTGASMPGSFPNSSGVAHDGDDEVIIPPETDYDMGDDDMELQAALAASLGGADEHNYGAYTQQLPSLAQSAPVAHPSQVQPVSVDDDNDDGDYIRSAASGSTEPADPVAASMARNQVLLQRMLREQEAAFREGMEEDNGAAAAAAARRRQQEEEEESQVRAAIEASMADHPGGGGEDAPGGQGGGDDDAESGRQTPPARPVPAPARVEQQSRMYDDEDAELQAALRASLVELPPGFVHPLSPQPPSVPSRASAPLQPPLTASSSEASMEDDGSVTSSQPPTPATLLDVEEMRRRRLARFGASSGGSSEGSSGSQTPQN